MDNQKLAQNQVFRLSQKNAIVFSVKLIYVVSAVFLLFAVAIWIKGGILWSILIFIAAGGLVLYGTCTLLSQPITFELQNDSLVIYYLSSRKKPIRVNLASRYFYWHTDFHARSMLILSEKPLNKNQIKRIGRWNRSLRIYPEKPVLCINCGGLVPGEEFNRFIARMKLLTRLQIELS